MLNLYLITKNKITNKFLGVVNLPSVGNKKGFVLISYITEPFTMYPWQKFSNFHTNYWECYEIARLFSIRGYEVDIINWDNQNFIPNKKYTICVDIQNNLERFSKFLPKECKKVMHVVTSYWEFQNDAEQKRLLELKKRRGITVNPQRQVIPSKNPSYADFIEGFGNKSVHKTYANFGKPIFPIPISTVKIITFPENKNWSESRKNFLWFGGGGATLKGLDLVLEAFAKNPELELHICGPINAEKDFISAYKKELFGIKNIHFYGRIDPDSALFAEISKKCGAIVYPTFSEGTSGAVVQAMHAGLIPITTKQAGIYEDASAIILENPTIESINSAIISFSKLTGEEIRKMAKETWLYAHNHYTREKFSATYAYFIDNVLKIKNG